MQNDAISLHLGLDIVSFVLHTQTSSGGPEHAIQLLKCLLIPVPYNYRGSCSQFGL